MTQARRLTFYLISLVALGIMAVGIRQLIALIFDITIRSSFLTSIGAGAFNRQQFSLGLAMVVIGTPLWFVFWRVIQHHVREKTGEIGVFIRKFYLNLAQLVSILVGLSAAHDLIVWFLKGIPAYGFNSGAPASLIVAAAIWYYHWRVSEREGQPTNAARTLRRWQIYIITAFALIRLSFGVAQVLNLLILSLPVWDAIVQPQIWAAPLQNGLVWVMLGGLTWYYFWFRMAKDDAGSALRQVYFYLLAISGGAITALTAITIILYRLLNFGIGIPNIAAGTYLEPLALTIPLAIIGLVIWGYHQRTALEESLVFGEHRRSAQRVHLYLLSFISLGMVVAGLITVFGLFVDLIINSLSPYIVVSSNWWHGQLSLCLALLITGTPLFLYFWNQVIKQTEAGGAVEWKARSRRIFVYGIVIAAIITLAADLVNIIYQPLNGMLQNSPGVQVWRSTKWSIQTLIVAGPLLWYFWMLVRTGQKRGAETARAGKSVTLLAGAWARNALPTLETKLGVKINYLIRSGPEESVVLTDVEIDILAAEIQAAAGNNIFLIVESGKVTVIPYETKSPDRKSGKL